MVEDTGPGGNPRRPSRTVLIVDDARMIRTMLKRIVRKLEDVMVVGEAVNGQEALRMYDEFHPDLITMDITMPVLDGLSAARNILSRDPRANIVMITSVGQETVMREAIEAGACDFIVKPFEEERILSAMKRALSRVA